MPSSSLHDTPERVLHRLDWEVLRRLDGLLQGDYRGFAHGAGLDFADLREYQPHDDVRHIDWNVTARLDTPMVREYREDRDVTAWFLIDRSSSMGFGVADRPKKVVLVDFVTAMARLLTRGGNRVGALLYNDGVERVVEPRSGRTQVLRLVHDLQRSPTPSTAETDLAALLTIGANTIRRRSLVFVVSDFISTPGWERSLQLLTARHDVVAVRIVDPTEDEIPSAGIVVVEDAETGEQLVVDTSDPVFRRRFAEAAEQRLSSLRSGIERTGVDMFSISTDDDLTTALVRMSAFRKKRAGR